jgi:hypothetical protein
MVTTSLWSMRAIQTLLRRTTTMPVVKDAPFILSDVGYLPAPVVKPLTM